MFRRIILAHLLWVRIAIGSVIAYSAIGDLKRVTGHYNAFQAPIMSPSAIYDWLTIFS